MKLTNFVYDEGPTKHINIPDNSYCAIARDDNGYTIGIILRENNVYRLVLLQI